MSQEPQDDPFSETHLDSPAYRDRLMRKLNCLIAVLEVATAKVRRSLNEPSSDTERLTRICTNLQSTLEVCVRARTALERRRGPARAGESARARETAQTGASEATASDALVPRTPEPAPKRAPAVRDAARRLPRKREAPKRPGVGRDERSAAEKRRFQKLGPIDAGMIGACDLDDLAGRLQG